MAWGPALASAAAGAGAQGAQGSAVMLGQIAQGIGANIAWDRSKQNLRNQQLWAQYMRSTAYQATVDDLKKAGLSPILALGKVGATGAPSGFPTPAPENPAAGAASSARQTARMMSEIKLLKEQGKKTEEDRKTAAAEAEARGELLDLSKQLRQAETDLTLEKKRTQEFLTEQSMYGVTSAKSAAAISEYDIEAAVERALQAQIGQQYYRSGSGQAAEKVGRFLSKVPLSELLLGVLGGYVARGRRSKTPEVKTRKKDRQIGFER